MEILKYLQWFITESYWLDEKVPEKARAIFTTWCLTNFIDVDTKLCTGINFCDNVLTELYKTADLEAVDVSYEDFYNYMVELIV